MTAWFLTATHERVGNANIINRTVFFLQQQQNNATDIIRILKFEKSKNSNFNIQRMILALEKTTHDDAEKWNFLYANRKKKMKWKKQNAILQRMCFCCFFFYFGWNKRINEKKNSQRQIDSMNDASKVNMF